jgi:DNA-binding winged helix-turn-helix (wHTH) protein/tetratricopeptide (TPR) repeat protein
MPQHAPAGRIVRFGSFEADLQEGKLTKAGIRIRLQEQPFQILALLLERPGQLVTREEIRQKLWSRDTFVEFDDALNTAVRKLRAALNDSADNPRFLETVPRRGYRFVAPVAWAAEPRAVAPITSPVRQRPYLYFWLAAALIVAVAAVGGYRHFHRLGFQITPKDTIVLADFANTTGDTVFDDTLKTALNVSLRQSPFLNVLPDSEVARTLQQMTRPANTKLTPEVARELCQRAGSKAFLAGAIGSLASEYVLGLKAVNCQIGDTLAEEQVTAASKEKVLDALGEAVSKLRGAEYYSYATGELDKAAQTFQEEIESYPREDAAYVNLGLVYALQGQHEKAAGITRQAVRLAPDAVSEYEDLANYALALQRFDETRQIIHEAQARKLDDYLLRNVIYALGFLASDSAAMAEQQQWFAGKPEFGNVGLALASDTEAYDGRLAKARELTKRAVDSAIRADSKENGALWQANAALQQAAYGNAAGARQSAAQALKLAPASRGIESEAALAFAMAGDMTRAESLAQDLGKRYPLDTQMQSLWLPAIQAQLALDKKNPALALNTLQTASPIELGWVPFVLNISCLYHVYVRGEAYLAAGQGGAAAAEFQKILDHSGIVWNCWTGALAHLGVARANALESRASRGADAEGARVRALAAYRDFLTLWKDADPDIPILKEAQAEYAKLQ